MMLLDRAIKRAYNPALLQKHMQIFKVGTRVVVVGGGQDFWDPHSGKMKTLFEGEIVQPAMFDHALGRIVTYVIFDGFPGKFYVVFAGQNAVNDSVPFKQMWSTIHLMEKDEFAKLTTVWDAEQKSDYYAALTGEL